MRAVVWLPLELGVKGGSLAFREWSLITGREGGYKVGVWVGAVASEVLPLQIGEGGAEKF